MKVYSVQADTTNYRRLLPADESVWDTDMLFFDCEPKAAVWKPPPLYCFNPKKKPGDFVNLRCGCLIAEPSAMSTIAGCFEMAGELLPLPFEGRVLTLLNVLECVNSLDSDRSEWEMTAEGERVRLIKYVFHPRRFSESSLFKIPETSRAEVLAVEHECDPETEFKAAVESGTEGPDLQGTVERRRLRDSGVRRRN